MDTTPQPKQRFRLPEIEQIIVPATQDTPEIAVTPASPKSSPTEPAVTAAAPNSLQVPSSARRKATPQWLLDEIAKSAPLEPFTGASIQPLFASRRNSIAEIKPLFASRDQSTLEVKSLNLKLIRKRASTAPQASVTVAMSGKGPDPLFDEPPKTEKDDPKDDDEKKPPFGGSGKKVKLEKPIMVSVSDYFQILPASNCI